MASCCFLRISFFVLSVSFTTIASNSTLSSDPQSSDGNEEMPAYTFIFIGVLVLFFSGIFTACMCYFTKKGNTNNSSTMNTNEDLSFDRSITNSRVRHLRQMRVESLASTDQVLFDDNTAHDIIRARSDDENEIEEDCTNGTTDEDFKHDIDQQIEVEMNENQKNKNKEKAL